MSQSVICQGWLWTCPVVLALVLPRILQLKSCKCCLNEAIDVSLCLCALTDGYNPKSSNHRSMLLCLLMTSCDLSDQTKGWKTTRKIAVSSNIWRVTSRMYNGCHLLCSNVLTTWRSSRHIDWKYWVNTGVTNDIQSRCRYSALIDVISNTCVYFRP